jgi:hypothetical protein
MTQKLGGIHQFQLIRFCFKQTHYLFCEIVLKILYILENTLDRFIQFKCEKNGLTKNNYEKNGDSEV